MNFLQASSPDAGGSRQRAASARVSLSQADDPYPDPVHLPFVPGAGAKGIRVRERATVESEEFNERPATSYLWVRGAQ